ncbi:aspartate/glutamate racemase family protein [Pseudonocardia kunmingensis]|uniref:aspartate/glutamate racemase family protein n=1 Tax=Pseudonocardia kunmingensis TaxID=630975 RepID=UPI001153A0B2|nr:aspartate/glutamate racemase family protein [Pseudonocardia kunmingensis]
MITIGFLHTSPVHVPTFRELLADADPGARDVHVVDEQLLADARARGVDAGVEARVLERLRELGGHRPDVVVCTCSTVSGHAEQLAGQARLPVLRIDRPMAEEAVAGGGRVAVVAAVASTLGPTRQLLEECAAAAGTGAEIVEAPCLDAWAAFEAGDQAGYLERIARHVREVAGRADVVVLAQASMAAVADLVRDLDTPVLSSPRPAVVRAVDLARATRRGPGAPRPGDRAGTS